MTQPMPGSTKDPLGVKIFPVFFCVACALLLVILTLNGTLPRPQAFFIIPVVVAVIGYGIWRVNGRKPEPVGGLDVKIISTPYAFINKLFPFFFCGILGFIFFLALMNGALQKAPLFVVMPALMAVVGYFIWKSNTQNLMDEVDDCGDYLLVKKGGAEDTILLSNISNVNFTTLRRGDQPRINLTLEAPGKFGTEIWFAPPPNIFFPHKSEIADDLRARAAQARFDRGKP